MLDEADATDRIVSELDRRQVLAALVAVVVGRHDAERRAVRERERRAVEAVGQKDIRSQRVLERQHAEESSVEATEDHVPSAEAWSRARCDQSLVNVGEADAAPAQAEPAPCRDAVEVRDLLDPRKCRELSEIDLARRLHLAAHAQHEAVRDDGPHTDVGAEAGELADRALTRRQRGHAATIRPVRRELTAQVFLDRRGKLADLLCGAHHRCCGGPETCPVQPIADRDELALVLAEPFERRRVIALVPLTERFSTARALPTANGGTLAAAKAGSAGCGHADRLRPLSEPAVDRADEALSILPSRAQARRSITTREALASERGARQQGLLAGAAL